MQAMDIDAPVITVELGGRAYELRFDNEQIRRTELCYSAATGVRMGYLGILTQAHQKIFGALCALCWGAIASAESATMWPDGNGSHLRILMRM